MTDVQVIREALALFRPEKGGHDLTGADIDAEHMPSCRRCAADAALDRLVAERDALLALVAAAGAVTKLYPSIAGTAILIRDANRHVPRNDWDDIADAAYGLCQALSRVHDLETPA